MRKGRVVLAVIVLGALAASCAPALQLYVNPDADMTVYRRVGFVTFTNMSPDRYAGERVSRAFETQLLMTERFQIVDAIEFQRALQRGGVDPSRLTEDSTKLRQVAVGAAVDGIVRGTVTEYQVQRNGTDEVPVVSFDVEMLDAPTGTVVWRTAISAKGRGRMALLGVSGSRTFAKLTQDACARAVGQLRAKAF